MPVVAQISVDFANQNNIVDGRLQTNSKAVGPLALARYCLRSREKSSPSENFGNNDQTYLTYDGGFISAGDKVNYKHSDFQVRGNVDLEKSLYVDNIYSRRKENTDALYQNERASFDRGVTISPRNSEQALNFISINSTASSKTSNIQVQHANIPNSIILTSSSAANKIDITTSNLNITGIVKSENQSTTMWVKSMSSEVATALAKRDYNNPILTDNYNALNVRDLVSHVVGTRPPLYINGSFTLLNDHDDQTIIINSAVDVIVSLPVSLREGLQTSFVRAGTGNVFLRPIAPAVALTSPEANFRKLAFTNSVATVLLASGNRYFLFGDLLPDS